MENYSNLEEIQTHESDHTRRNQLVQPPQDKTVFNKDIDIFLNEMEITDDDPAVVICWNRQAISNFIRVANNGGFPPPRLSITNYRQITPVTLFDAFVDNLSPVIDDRIRRPYFDSDLVLGPNTTVQYGEIIALLVHFSGDVWINEISKNLINQRLPNKWATVYLITENKPIKATPLQLDHGNIGCIFT